MHQTSQRRHLIHIVLLGLLVVLTSACQTGGQSRADLWPTVDALPEAPPDSLSAEAPTSVLRTGTDGFVYLVGGFPAETKAGTPFLARYSGEWPLEELPRPSLAAGRVVRTFGDKVALVHLSYVSPNAELDGLEVTWEPDATEAPVDKGLVQVAEVKTDPYAQVKLPIGKSHGVREGDFFAVLSSAVDSPSDAQLSRRLESTCLIKEATDESAWCAIWRGSSRRAAPEVPEVGQDLVFLEHTFGAAPRHALIQVAAVEGSDKAQAALKQAMERYVGSVIEPHATVGTLDLSVDATVSDFHREADKVDARDVTQILVGATVKKVDGADHLFVNYTGVGPSSGPGMVAAPPEGGVDLGPVDALDEDRLAAFAGVVWSGLLVYRGQTSEALVELHGLLGDPDLSGPLRWHARDQFAMRWGALDRYREALWLVMQDEAVALAKDDRKAWLNALGTRVRLYDFLELPAQAVSAARRYLDEQRKDGSKSAVLSALAMYGEMLMGDERVDDAMEVMAELKQMCPEGCQGDLHSYLAALFWSVPPEANQAQDQILEAIVAATEREDVGRTAATRIYQGLTALRDESFDQALIAFLEAKRLYEKEDNRSGKARADFFAFLAQLSRGRPQEAFELAQEAREIRMDLRDFEATARILDRMSAIYTNPEFLEKPGPYLRSAHEVMTGAVETKIAKGDFGGASESLLSLGGFLLRIGRPEQATTLFEQAVVYGVTHARFDVAAMAHLYRAVIARGEGDLETFRDEIGRAQMMGQLSEDPNILQAIEETLNPEKKKDVPTQLL